MFRLCAITVLLASSALALPLSDTWHPQLYGLNHEGRLETVNSTSGETAPFGESLLSLGLVLGQGQAAVDLDSNVVHTIPFNSSSNSYVLASMSINTGTIETIPLPIPMTGFVGLSIFIEFDEKTGDVIVTGRTAAAKGNHQVFRVNLKKKSVTPIAEFGDMDFIGGTSVLVQTNSVALMTVAHGPSSLDIQQVHVDTGRIALPYPDVGFISTLSYDMKTGNVFGVGLKSGANGTYMRTLNFIDTKTWEQKEISEIPGFMVIPAGIQALCPICRKVFLYMTKGQTNVTANDVSLGEFGRNIERYVSVEDRALYLVSISIDTGEVLSSVAACADPASCARALFIAQKIQ